MDVNTFAVIGNVDAGKSSLIGVLKSKELDNGKGRARENIMKLKHEILSGNTTNGNLVKIRSNDSSDKYVRLLDIAGHDRYFNNSMRAMTEYNPSYAMLVVSAVKGIDDISSLAEICDVNKIRKGKIIQNMNKTYLTICGILQLPIIVVITKVDHCTEQQLKDTKHEITSYLKQLHYKSFITVTENNFEKSCDDYNNNSGIYLPIFTVSNVTGESIDLLTKFLFAVDKRDNYPKGKEHLRKFAEKEKFNNLFEIYNTYHVKGKGLIVYGKCKLGEFKQQEEFNIGPFSNGYLKVRIRSLHDDSRNEVDSLKEGMYGCLCIKTVNNKDKLSKKMLRRGKVVTDYNDYFSEITCSSRIGHHQTTIEKKYKSYIHCNNVGDTITIIEADTFPMRSRENHVIKFKFNNYQFIYPGSKFVIRDDNIKIYGLVSTVFKAQKNIKK